MGRRVRRGRRTLDRHRAPGAALAGRGMAGLGARAAQRLQYGTQGGEPNASRFSRPPWRQPSPQNPRTTSAARDENAAKVLSVGRFTILQILFATLLYSPGLLASLDVLSSRGNRKLLRDRRHLDLHRRRHRFVSAQPAPALRHVCSGSWRSSSFSGRRRLSQQRDARRLPQVEQDAPAGLVHRTNGRALCLLPLRAIYRSAPLMAFALRQLGATVGRNLQCASDAYLSGPLDLIASGDNIAIQTGAYVQTTRWSGPELARRPDPP